jgi:hypothetical protein
MDLFDLGIQLNTARVDEGITDVKLKLKELGGVATKEGQEFARSFSTAQVALENTARATANLATTSRTASALIDKGFQGNARQAMAVAASIEASNRFPARQDGGRCPGQLGHEEPG